MRSNFAHVIFGVDYSSQCKLPVKSNGGAEPTSSESGETKEFQTFRKRELQNQDTRMQDDDDLNFARKSLNYRYDLTA